MKNLVMRSAVMALFTAAVLCSICSLATPALASPLSFTLVSAGMFGVKMYDGIKEMRGQGIDIGGLRAAAITREVWIKDIVEELFPKNSFMDRCFNESDDVVNGTTVHIPQAASHPAIVKNRASFPATAVERTDTDANYTLEEYSSDPMRIRNAEQAELSYDKVKSILMAMNEALRTRVALDLAWKWSTGTAANIVRTTGADSAENLPNSTATGTRKVLTLADVRKARKILNKHDVAYEGRILLLDSNMLDELMSDSTLLVRDNAQEVDLKAGTLIRLFGFEVMERSSVVTYTNAGTPVKKDPAAAAATSDNGAAIAYGPSYVSRALGAVDFYENIADALHYGNVYSANVRCGGRQRRGDAKGVVNIVQTVGA